MSLILLAVSVIFTLLVAFVGRAPVGPENSEVGFATINKVVHNFTGTNMDLYIITDWLGLIPFAFAVVFGITGLFFFL